MLRSPRIRVLVAMMAALVVSLSSAAFADTGTIQLTIYKAGLIVGGSGGSGTLDFNGKRYRLGVGAWASV